MKYTKTILTAVAFAGLFGCQSFEQPSDDNAVEINNNQKENVMKYEVDRFEDVSILRYKIPGFDALNVKQKELLYYLSQAANAGRDIIFDQHGKYNLAIRSVLEAVYQTYEGNKESDNFQDVIKYMKQVWFANGIYHHYSEDKFQPDFGEGYFRMLVSRSDMSSVKLPQGMSMNQLLDKICPLMFDASVMPKRQDKTPGVDIVKASAVNFYDNDITKEEAEAYYESISDSTDATPVEHGLNAKLVRENGKLVEKRCKVGGLYTEAIEPIVYWLRKAQMVAESEDQKESLGLLIQYYETGDLKTWDAYNIQWVKDTAALVDGVNGFIEVYADPLGLHGSWEAMPNFRIESASERTQTLSDNAQWFEDNSPVDPRFKKEEVKGIIAKVINTVQLGGDCFPATPIGINLPNSDWVRKDHGSKSVTIQNIMEAYHEASKESGFLQAFYANQEDIKREEKYGLDIYYVHVDLHECLGHGSGKLLPGVSSDALQNYHSPIEETRADLFALYYSMDSKMQELGMVPNIDAAMAGYLKYFVNGMMTQLFRIQPGKQIEQAHMRNRSTITRWCYERGKADNVVELIKRDGKTFVQINDYKALHGLVGELLKEVQRIKSEGDYEAAKNLVETYGIKVDPELHQEILERYAALGTQPYQGFVNPKLEPVMEGEQIVDVKLTYEEDYIEQMLRLSKEYGFLPLIN